MNAPAPPSLGRVLIRCWILISATLSGAGWILSSLHALNVWGYLATLGGLGMAVKYLFSNPATDRVAFSRQLSWSRLVCRYRRFFPMAFIVLLCLAALGGLIYRPNNYDALSYRLPRMLHWMASEQWHWIDTGDQRLNTRTCGFEWLTMPLLLLTRSDRLFFLANTVSQLLLPAVIFRVLLGLGVGHRVAWHWMWLLPTGYNFVLQTGSIANDTFAAVYGLAALDFALTARQSKKASDLGWSLVSAALMVGAKSSNLPLLLPWFIAVLPSWRLLLPSPLKTAMVALFALLISPAPTFLLNYQYSRNWSGYGIEPAGFLPTTPAMGLLGNTLILPMQNLVPPVFPFARQVVEKGPGFLEPLYSRLVPHFERGFLYIGELQNEEWAGLGFGLCMFLACSWLGGRFCGPNPGAPNRTGQDQGLEIWLWAILLAPLGSLLFYMCSMGVAPGARIISPYYLFLAPLILRGRGQRAVTQARWWQYGGRLVFGLALMVVVLTPSRPLWPARQVFARVAAWHPESKLWARAQRVYSVYGQRADILAPLRALIPPEATTVGFVGAYTDLETSLWRPYGSRRLVCIDPPQFSSGRPQPAVHYVVVSSFGLAQRGKTMSQWLAEHHGELLHSIELDILASSAPETWHLVRLLGKN